MEFFRNFWVIAVATGAIIGLILYLFFGNPNREGMFGTTGLYAKVFLIAIALFLVAALIIRIGGFGTSKIHSWYDLDAIRNNLDRSYILTNNLDSTTAGYAELASATANQGRGWQPLGRSSIETWEPPFSGSFDGQGFEIRDLFINRPDESLVGLFGELNGYGLIKNIGVVNATMTGKSYVGGLVAKNAGAVSNSFCNGTVTGTGDEYIGGLVGLHLGTVSNSYFNGKVIGNEEVGGLVGRNSGTVSNSYSAGSVTGNSWVGGLVGSSQGKVSSSFWDTKTSQQTTSAGGVGKNTEAMQNIDTFSAAGWNITSVASFATRNSSYIWNIVDGQTYPFLSWQS